MNVSGLSCCVVGEGGRGNACRVVEDVRECHGYANRHAVATQGTLAKVRDLDEAARRLVHGTHLYQVLFVLHRGVERNLKIVRMLPREADTLTRSIRRFRVLKDCVGDSRR